MAQYRGYVNIPHDSYQQWRDATFGNGYDVDLSWGNQCWDYCAELWYQYGLRLVTKAGGGGAADCWLVSRSVNARNPFIAIDRKEDIKRGDVIVWNRSNVSKTGHIGFADEDYNNTNEILSVGQVPSIHGQNGNVSLDRINLSSFLGVFRNTDWEETPPTPPPTPTSEKKKKFPFVIAKHYWWGGN